MYLFPEYDWTGNFPVRSVYSVFVCVSASVANQNSSQGAFMSGTGCMSSCCNVFAFKLVLDIERRFFLVLCSCPFMVASVSWRCLLIRLVSMPGMPKS